MLMSPSGVEMSSLALPYRGKIQGIFHAAVGTCLTRQQSCDLIELEHSAGHRISCRQTNGHMRLDQMRLTLLFS